MGARRTPNELLRARLKEAHWSGAELARALNAAGHREGIRVTCDRSNVSHWLAGTRPRPPARELLVRVFTKRLGRAITAQDLGLAASEGALDPTRGGPAPGYSAMELAYGTDAAETALGETSRPGYVSAAARHPYFSRIPRQRGERNGPAAWGNGAPRADVEARTYRPRSRPSRAARELAELIQEHRDPRQQRRLRELPYRRPRPYADGGRIVLTESASGRERERPSGPGPRTPDGASAAVRSALELFELKGGGAAREMITGELSGASHLKAAKLCRMLGRAWADELAHGAAQRALELSRSLALEAGEPVVEAMALRDMSVLALELGRISESVGLAEAAVGTGWERAGAGTRAFLLTQRGVAQAVTGDSQGAVRDMDGAEFWIDRGDDDENGAYPLGALLYQRSRMYRAEGDQRRSVSALELSLSLRPPGEQRSRALIRIELAHQHLGCGDYAAVAEELRMLSPCHESLKSARVDAALAYLRGRALAPEPAPLPPVAYRGRC